MKTLKLFNAVVAKENNSKPFMSQQGFIIEPNAIWAKDKIVNFYAQEKLNGNDLNKTFHKSWHKIKISSRFELLLEQLEHYMSTYGSNFTDEVYIPNEILEIPDLDLKFKVIKAYTKEEMTEKCLSLLKSGVALKEETIDDILTVLVDSLGYSFTGKENFKNKEAVIKIGEMYGVYPNNPVEFLRLIIYKTTGGTLLIKNSEMISAIKMSNYNPTVDFKKFGLENLAEIFNRFKPLFLAYKNRAPKTINRISKLSKRYHKPMVTNPLNTATHILLSDSDKHWLDNATPFALFKALSACYSRMNGQYAFVYRIRNGKSWAEERTETTNQQISYRNFSFIINYLKDKFDLSKETFFIPKDIKYGLPTSEKMFVGNVPVGTKISGNSLAVGIYWVNKWGARDMDLSGVNIGGKIGWNSSYNQGDGSLMYSGDITNAPEGAVEYLYASNGLKVPTLVVNSIFSGDLDAGYKIIIGKGGDITEKHMMNPNNLIFETKTESISGSNILGVIIPEGNKQSFVLLNFGTGNTRVYGSSEISDISTKALYQQWANPLSLNDIINDLGGKITDYKTEATVDLSLDVLERDTLINIFK